MPYVLGAATVTNAPFRKQNTMQGDGWASLAKAYGFTDGGTAIMNAQLADPTAKSIMAPGGRITSAGIQRWIKSLPGWTETAKFPFDPKSNPGTTGPDGKPEGWAFFTAQTQILLPDMPRLDGKTPQVPTPSTVPLPTVTAVEPEVQEAGVNPLVVVGGLLLLFALFGGKKDKKGGTSSGGGSVAVSRWSV